MYPVREEFLLFGVPFDWLGFQKISAQLLVKVRLLVLQLLELPQAQITASNTSVPTLQNAGSSAHGRVNGAGPQGSGCRDQQKEGRLQPHW
jgi:hypothetical protein